MSELLLRLAGDATVRGITTRDGMRLFAVFDCISVVCDKNAAYARQVWKRLISDNSKHKVELEGLVFAVTLCTGKKNSPYETPVMTLQGLQRLVIILDGKVASEFRVIVLDTFTRFMAGDVSMIREIHSNTASVAPVHQAYRQALTQEPVLDAVGTKRQLDREEALFNIELHERHTTLNERQMTLHERGLALYEKSLALPKRT